VSYRDIAAEMGIKSASLHYHFPKKEDLGTALTQRYSDNFASALQDIASRETNPQNRIKAFVEIYSFELKHRGLVCLCAVLGAETDGLPDRVSEEIKRFYEKNIDWLTAQYTALGKGAPAAHAKTTLSLLSGAMIVSASSNDNSIFDAAIDNVLQTLS